VIGIDEATAIDGNVRDLHPAFLEMLAGIKHGMMLDCRGNDVVSSTNQTENRKIVALSASACEYDLCRAATEKFCDRLACALDRRPVLLPVVVNRRRVPEMLTVVRSHGIQNLRKHRRGGVIVEVTPPHIEYFTRFSLWPFPVLSVFCSPDLLNYR